MRAKIKYSYIYNSQWYPHLSKEEFDEIWSRVLAIGDKFEKLFNKYVDKIINLISKFSGYEWVEEYIPVYLVKIHGRSFSDPLTLKVRNDIKLMLVILTHELCHNNMAFKFNDSLEMENVMNLVTTYVFKELDLDVKEQIKTLIGFTKRKFKEKYRPLNLDLSKTTVRECVLSKANIG